MQYSIPSIHSLVTVNPRINMEAPHIKSHHGRQLVAEPVRENVHDNASAASVIPMRTPPAVLEATAVADDQPKSNTRFIIVVTAIVIIAVAIVIGVAVPFCLWIAVPNSIFTTSNAGLGSFNLLTHIHSKNCIVRIMFSA